LPPTFLAEAEEETRRQNALAAVAPAPSLPLFPRTVSASLAASIAPPTFSRNNSSSSILPPTFSRNTSSSSVLESLVRREAQLPMMSSWSMAQNQAFGRGVPSSSAAALLGGRGPTLHDTMFSGAHAANLRASALAGSMQQSALHDPRMPSLAAAAAGLPSPVLERNLYCGGYERLNTAPSSAMPSLGTPTLDAIRMQMLQESMRNVTNPTSILSSAPVMGDSLVSSSRAYLERDPRDRAMLEREALRRHSLLAAQRRPSPECKRGREEEELYHPAKRGNYNMRR